VLTVCLPFVLSAKTTEILDRGPHHRTVREIWQYTNDLGQAVSLTNRWTERENGMHYRHNGQWTESEERIHPTPQGAVAQTGPMKVLFAKNINSQGSIDILTSDVSTQPHKTGISLSEGGDPQTAEVVGIKSPNWVCKANMIKAGF
jgi:hypothetical protein